MSQIEECKRDVYDAIEGHTEHGDGLVIEPRKRRKRRPHKKYRGAAKNMPEFKPTWINAFIIMLLRKNCHCADCPDRMGGSQSMTLEQLKAFDEVTQNKQPHFAWNGELQAFTVTTPEYNEPVIKIPAKPKLIT